MSGPTCAGDSPVLGDTSMKTNEHGNIRVQVTSVDGNLTHPFKRSDTLSVVQRFAYDRLVQDKSAVTLDSTSMEFGGKAQDLSLTLGALIDDVKNPGRDIDLSVALTWVSQGG